MEQEEDMATVIETLKAHPWVERVEHDSDGWWAYLKPGRTCIYSGAHACHEDSPSATLRAVRDSEPCECDGCTGKEP
jgi:hypothetical protein